MTSWQVAVGGREAGGTTVGAGLALPAGVGVGAAVAVGVGVGAVVGVAVAEALGDGELLGVDDGVALGAALALGLGDGSGADGLTRMRSVVPLMSSRFIWLAPRWSRRPTPCKSLRNACSCAMTSSGQAIWVPASGPIATTFPFVVYGPW